MPGRESSSVCRACKRCSWPAAAPTPTPIPAAVEELAGHNDFVIATGESHTVREFVEKAFKEVGITLLWEGRGVSEVGRDAGSGEIFVQVDPRYFRPTEVEELLGDPTKARTRLGWEPKVRLERGIEATVAHFDELLSFDRAVAEGEAAVRRQSPPRLQVV